MRWIIGLILLAATATTSGAAVAAAGDGPRLTILPTRLATTAQANSAVAQVVADNVDLHAYRAVRAQLIYKSDGSPDHVLVYLHSKTFHRVDYLKISVNAAMHATEVTRDYAPTAQDQSQQPGTAGRAATCPDATVQFLAFAPNDDSLEQQVTVEVANYATAKGLKVKQLLLDDATRQNYLDYMTCPNLLGNFYDGDANPSSMTTVDGELDASDFSTTLKNSFKLHVTNIWLACEAYNDPMLSAVQDDAQARKYAAGVNDLEIGPSDKAAACAMEAALDGQPMTAAFQSCYQKIDTPSDHWGFDGRGTDNFWD